MICSRYAQTLAHADTVINLELAAHILYNEAEGDEEWLLFAHDVVETFHYWQPDPFQTIEIQQIVTDVFSLLRQKQPYISLDELAHIEIYIGEFLIEKLFQHFYNIASYPEEIEYMDSD